MNQIGWVRMLEASDLVAFVAVTDLTQALDFYQNRLGLRLVEANEFAAVFDANATMLRVTAVDLLPEVPHTVLGWRVPDIDATVAALAAENVQVVRYDQLDQDAAGVWTAPGGDRVAWFKDPAGNTLSLTQFG